MKKILTIIILTLLSSNISYSKDNPLNIFKKEILGGDAKKHMKESLRQSKPLKKILSVTVVKRKGPFITVLFLLFVLNLMVNLKRYTLKYLIPENWKFLEFKMTKC